MKNSKFGLHVLWMVPAFYIINAPSIMHEVITESEIYKKAKYKRIYRKYKYQMYKGGKNYDYHTLTPEDKLEIENYIKAKVTHK